MYQILPYSKRQAKKLNVNILPSKNQNKKIDVFDKKWNFITSIGAKGYLDYPTYLKYYGKTIANKRRKLYKIRHKKDRMVKGTSGFYADKILW